MQEIVGVGGEASVHVMAHVPAGRFAESLELLLRGYLLEPLSPASV